VAGFDLTLSTEWVDEGCEETSELSDLHDQDQQNLYLLAVAMAKMPVMARMLVNARILRGGEVLVVDCCESTVDIVVECSRRDARVSASQRVLAHLVIYCDGGEGVVQTLC